MQTSSKYMIFQHILSIIVIVLISSAIIMELMPEEEAKAFVIPTLVAALFVGGAQIPNFRKH